MPQRSGCRHLASLEQYRGAGRRPGRYPDRARPRLAAVPAGSHRARSGTPHSRAADGSFPALDITIEEQTSSKLDDLFPGPGGEAPDAYTWS